MTRLPQVTPRQVLGALARAGFELRRIKGSHHYLVHKGDPTRRTTVAVHPGDLPSRDVLDTQASENFSGRVYEAAVRDRSAAFIRI
jgi:predicted RNA binding protein YcfA (HicA-like mRNA interferase family)